MANMENEELFTLTDEEGNESQFALIGELEIEGQIYLALVPADNDDADEYVVLKVEVDENGEELLVTIDDDDEFDRVAIWFIVTRNKTSRPIPQNVRNYTPSEPSSASMSNSPRN